MSETNERQCHILVADDEPHIGRIIKMKLEQGPFRVTLAYDGQEAIDVLEAQPDIDLVLLDLMMPNLSGLDVLARIRATDRLKHLPCIILTAAGQEAQHQKGYAIVAALADETLLLVLLRPSADLGGLLFDVRRYRGNIAALI